MVQRIRNLVLKYRDLIVYVVFGGLTTLVNYLVYLPLLHCVGLSAAVSNSIAWAAAVVFAFFTNKPFVFHSKDWSCKTVLKELGSFVGCRVASGALETGVLWLTVDILGGNGTVWKLLTSVLVIVVNYVASKLLVFRKREG